MNKYEIIKRIEEFAPPQTQESWDASGWIAESGKSEIEKILFALTVTEKIFNQALEKGCDMIISHHPLFAVPLKYKKLDIYCAHTNLDKAKGGTTDTLMKALGLEGKAFGDFVRIAEFDTDVSVEFLKSKLLSVSPKLRTVNNTGIKTVRTVGFCAGSGSEFIEETPCNAFVTGDLKFHTALETDKVVFDIGHFESEIFAPELLKKIAGVNENGIIADEKSPFI